MNKYAVQHIMDSSYCFPTGEHDITIRLRTAKDDISQVWIFYESKYRIQEHQNKAEMTKVFSGSEFDYYSISLHLEDTRLAYVFYLFDGKEYKYFSEAQYKELFTELMSEAKLELKFEEIDYLTFDGPEKQANGRMPKLEFTLFDTETGFFETTHITGEGIDKGDKAGYKAYTGALKYYLANTFMVATGDDPEKDSPDNKMNDVQSNGRKEKTMNTPVIVEDIKKEKATEKQVNTIMKLLSEDDVARCLSFYSIETLNDLTISQASAVIKNFSKGAKQ